MITLVSSVALPFAYIVVPFFSYHLNNVAFKHKDGVDRHIFSASATAIVTIKIFDLVKDSAEVMMDKGTFNSAAVFTTNVLVASICTNSLMVAAALHDEVFYKGGCPNFFAIGFIFNEFVINSVSKELSSVGDILFNKNEAYAEFENSLTLKKSLYSVTSFLISYNYARLFTEIADISDVKGNLVKLGLATILGPLVFSVLYTDNTLKVSGDTNSKIDELGHDGE